MADAIAATVYMRPSEVHACLREIPLNASSAALEVRKLSTFLQFQSTLGFLKNPPPTYDLPAVDVLGSLDNITSRVLAGAYKNELDLERDIYHLIAIPGDGHLTAVPNLIAAFQWVTNVNLISVSSDGTQIPEIYFAGK